MAKVKRKGETTKGRGRPVTEKGRDPTFTLRMPVATRRRAERLAKEKGITLAKAILSILEKHLPKGHE